MHWSSDLIERLQDDLWIMKLLHIVSMPAPGFVYFYVAYTELFIELNFLKLIILSLIYSIPGYILSKVLSKHKSIQNTKNLLKQKIKELEEQFLAVKNTMEQSNKKANEKFNKLKAEFDNKARHLKKTEYIQEQLMDLQNALQELGIETRTKIAIQENYINNFKKKVDTIAYALGNPHIFVIYLSVVAALITKYTKAYNNIDADFLLVYYIYLFIFTVIMRITLKKSFNDIKI